MEERCSQREKQVQRHQALLCVQGGRKYRAVGSCRESLGWKAQLVKTLVYLAKAFFGSSYFVEIRIGEI